MTNIEKYLSEYTQNEVQRLTHLMTQGQLALDTINVTLNMAGYDVGAMNQFQKAHALMNMAMELKALACERETLAPYVEATFLSDYIRGG